MYTTKSSQTNYKGEQNLQAQNNFQITNYWNYRIHTQHFFSSSQEIPELHQNTLSWKIMK